MPEVINDNDSQRRETMKVVQCEHCWKKGSAGKLKLRWIMIKGGYVYNACIDCRKDLKGIFTFYK